MRATGTIFIRDLIFSDIVPNTIMIFNHNLKNDKNLITTNTVPLTSKILKKRNSVTLCNSNSVTHLRSYTNSTIAGNSAPISPVTPRDRQRRRAERRHRHAERRHRRAERRRLRIERRRLRIERRYRRIK